MSTKYLPRQLKQHPELIDAQDVITVVLDPKETYTVEDAKSKVEEFLNKEVD